MRQRIFVAQGERREANLAGQAAVLQARQVEAVGPQAVMQFLGVSESRATRNSRASTTSVSCEPGQFSGTRVSPCDRTHRNSSQDSSE